MWYAAIHSNQDRFGLYDSELGWNQTVLDRLTGVRPTSIPATPQLIDAEFAIRSNVWKLTSPEVSIQAVTTPALSGTTALKIVVPKPVDCQLYQHTVAGHKGIAPGRTLIHLLQGQTYCN